MTPPDYPQPVLAPPGAAPVAKSPVVRAPLPVRGASPDLFRRTLRMIAMLVVACIVFVGAMSVVAVTITSRAVGTGAKAADRSTDDSSTKKPLSI